MLARITPAQGQSNGQQGSGGGTGTQMECQEGCGGDPPPPVYAVAVTPDAGSQPTEAYRVVNTFWYPLSFTVENTGNATETYTFTCSGGGGLDCYSVSPTSVTLAPNAGTTVTVRYDVYAPTGNRLVTLAAQGTHDPAYDTGSYLVEVVDPPVVTLDAPGTGARTLVHNRQPVLRAFFLPRESRIDTTTTVLTFRGDTVSNLARHSSGLIEWEVDSTHWLRTGLPGYAGVDSGLVSIRSCGLSGFCETKTRWLVLAADSTPVIGFTGMPMENLGGGFSSGFGPGISVSGAEVETGFSIPSYVSMGTGHSAGLVYSTRQSYPRALVNADIDVPWPSGTPDRLTVRLKDGATVMDTVTFTGTSANCLTGSVHRCRVTLQADYSATTFATPTRKWLTLETQVTVGAVNKMSSDSVEVVLVDRRATHYGSGWWPAGVAQVFAAGSDRIVVGATGTATIYRGYGDSVYVPSPGNLTALVKTATGWELRPRGSLAKTRFNTSGQLASVVDINGNTVTFAYNGLGDLTSITDPVSKAITFGYDGNNRLATLTDPGSRVSRVRVDNTTNQLVYDSLAGPGARHDTTAYVYRSYPGSYTSVLMRLSGVLAGDSTRIVYDSTFKRRPVQVILATVQDETGASVNPVITYGAYERRGYGALASLDSVYVEMKDPRNNWSRSLLNRWGQSLTSWDALGLLGRSAFSAEGLALWSEGKNGDSSRVYHDYDAARRLLRSYICRGSCSGASRLRTDSLVYDANHRVIRSVDARGKVSQFFYDSLGRDTLSIAPDSSSFARTRYFANGQVDSTTASGETRGTHYQYDAATGNLLRVIDQTGDTLAINTYDTYGRVTQSEGKMHVMLDATQDTVQRRRSKTYYNEANQVDSARAEISNHCKIINGVCTITFWQLVHSGAVRYDQAGRDTASINGQGAVTVRHYDRLGRVLVAIAPSDSTPARRDSLVYDIAGNIKKTINRRGITIQHYFDSRNRDTLTTVPGVGDLKRAFGGPLDQLTRLWYANAADSLGGTNSSMSWVYDARGRVTADTTYTGGTARRTGYAYDAFERSSSLTDALGAWQTRYEASRGIVDSLITPYADTVEVLTDQQGRMAATIVQSGLQQRATTSLQWSPGGKLTELSNSVASPNGEYNSGTMSRPFATDTSSIALAPEWSQRYGAGDTVRVQRDSVQYDALERLTRWVRMSGNVQNGTDETYDFDQNDNISQPTGQGTYSTATDRLLYRLNGTASDSFSYDRSGNLTRQREASGNVWTYDYDALERLVTVRYNATLIARYAYDVLGHRIAKRVYSTASGGTVGFTRFSYHGGQVAFETDSAGSTIGLRYTWGTGTDQLLAVRDAVGNHFYTARDKLGSIRMLITRTGGWRIAERFSPYGMTVSRDTASTGVGVALRYRWTGREYDSETGFYYLRARYYSPTLRRFVAEDPVGTAGGSNVYAYAGGTPLEATDPSGLAPSDEGVRQRFESSIYAAPWYRGPGYFERSREPADWNFGLTFDDGLGFYSLTTSRNGWGTKWAIAQELKRTYSHYVEAYSFSKALHGSELVASQVFDGSESFTKKQYERVVDILSNSLSRRGSAGLNYTLWISQRLNLGYIFINDHSSPLTAAVTTPGGQFTAFRTDAFRQTNDILMNNLVHEEFHTGIIRGECAAYAEALRVTGVYNSAVTAYHCP